MRSEKFEIINIKGKKIRREKGIANLIGGFASIIYALSIATVGLDLAAQSLHSEIRGHAREVVRV